MTSMPVAPTHSPSVRGYLALELRRGARSPRFFGLVIAWPVAAYLLFSTVFGSNADASEGLPARVELMVAMAAFGAMGAVLLATGPRLAEDRAIGWLRQLQLTPLNKHKVEAARIASALILTLPAIIITFAVAAGLKDVRLSAFDWLATAGAICLGCVPFAAIGLCVGSLSSGEGATGLTIATYLAFAVLGGLWMPVKVLPAPMRTIAGLLPSNNVAQIGWRLAAGASPSLRSAIVLVLWLFAASVAASALGIRSSKRV